MPPEEILASSRDLIQDLAEASGLEGDMFRSYLKPELMAFASYVHLLPASERNHHRLPGGHFRHGLETAVLAAQMSRGLILDRSGSLRRRREMEGRWRACCAAAGLIHDIGKPVSDLTVRSNAGSSWNPFRETLWEWSRREGAYFLDWRQGRFRRHEETGIFALDLALCREFRAYLAPEGDPEILCSLYQYLAGSFFSSPISRIISLADQESARRDMAGSRLEAGDLVTSVPAERCIFEAVIQLDGELPRGPGVGAGLRNLCELALCPGDQRGAGAGADPRGAPGAGRAGRSPPGAGVCRELSRIGGGRR